MSDLLQHIRERRTRPDEDPRVLPLDDDETDDVLDAIASDNGRSALAVLFEEPSTPSEIASRLDTSVQNVHYHVTNLCEAGLIRPIDTIYSEKGNEMTVYAPANDPLVLLGDEDRRPGIERSLTQAVGGLALLGVASLFVQWGAARFVATGEAGSPVVGPASWTPGAARPVATVGWVVFDVLEPGLVFFVGCLVFAAVLTSLAERA